MLSPILPDSPISNYPLVDSAILHLGLLLPDCVSQHPEVDSRSRQNPKIVLHSDFSKSSLGLRALGMSAQQALNRSHNDGDACSTRSSSEYVRQKYLRIRRMKIRFDTGKSQKKLAADCSAQSSGKSVAKNSQMEVSRSASYQIACGNAADNLENETRNIIHENISSFCFCIASAHHFGTGVAKPRACFHYRVSFTPLQCPASRFQQRNPRCVGRESFGAGGWGTLAPSRRAR
jgi:hypothetical protein